jgi:hypothetical protein
MNWKIMFLVAVAFLWHGRTTKLADMIQSGALNNLAHDGSKPTTETRIARKPGAIFLCVV